MPKLIKRMPRFARKAAERYSAPTTPGWWQMRTGFGHSVSGVAVTAQNAITLPAFAACVRVISEDTSSLPIYVIKRLKGGGTKVIEDHDITFRMNRCPDGDAREMTSMQWREAWVTHTLTRGNGLAEIESANNGDLLGLHLLNPDRTEEYRGQNKVLQYRTDGNKYIPSANVLHLAMPGFNGITGWSPVDLLREAIGLGKAAELFGASLFGNGAIPKGILTHPGRLSPEAQTNLRASWNEIHQGPGNANKTAVLTEGMSWVNTQINPDEGQFQLTRQFQVQEVSRIFRVPLHKIGDLSNAHLNNIEASNLDYLQTVLRPWCVRIEQCLELKLLTDKEYRLGYRVRHDLRELLRAAIKDRAIYYQAMINLGMSPNEIFELEDMNPIPVEQGGNRRFISVNSAPLDPVEAAALGARPGAAAPVAAPSPTSEDPPGSGEAQTGPAGYSHRLNGHLTHSNGEI